MPTVPHKTVEDGSRAIDTYTLPATWFVYAEFSHELLGHVAFDGAEYTARHFPTETITRHAKRDEAIAAIADAEAKAAS